jgi:hypothetical protein
MKPTSERETLCKGSYKIPEDGDFNDGICDEKQTWCFSFHLGKKLVPSS